MNLWTLLIVGLGGALGATARYVVSREAMVWCPGYVGLGTLIVNVVGCLAIGYLAGAGYEHRWMSLNARLFLVTGVLGGLTTFSALSLETVGMSRQSPALLWGGLHAIANFTGGVTAVLLGEWFARRLGG
ncbi:MAG: CrcB family protein [Planctomycetaceae bacterium]|nr:CrcB family protein [Planctomycetaceae bacterium]